VVGVGADECREFATGWAKNEDQIATMPTLTIPATNINIPVSVTSGDDPKAAPMTTSAMPRMVMAKEMNFAVLMFMGGSF